MYGLEYVGPVGKLEGHFLFGVPAEVRVETTLEEAFNLQTSLPSDEPELEGSDNDRNSDTEKSHESVNGQGHEKPLHRRARQLVEKEPLVEWAQVQTPLVRKKRMTTQVMAEEAKAASHPKFAEYFDYEDERGSGVAGSERTKKKEEPAMSPSTAAAAAADVSVSAGTPEVLSMSYDETGDDRGVDYNGDYANTEDEVEQGSSSQPGSPGVEGDVEVEVEGDQEDDDEEDEDGEDGETGYIEAEGEGYENEEGKLLLSKRELTESTSTTTTTTTTATNSEPEYLSFVDPIFKNQWHLVRFLLSFFFLSSSSLSSLFSLD